MPRFTHTHVITLNGREIPVRLADNGAAYTEAEWVGCLAADWERQADGTWTFQGGIPPGEYTVRGRRGGYRPNSGRKPTTGRGLALGGTPVYVRLSQEERGRVEAVLADDETAASVARVLLLEETRRRERG